MTPLLSIPAAAERLGISQNAARQAMLDGRLAARPVVDSEGRPVAYAVEEAALAGYVPAMRGRKPRRPRTEFERIRERVVRLAKSLGLETPQDACFDPGLTWDHLSAVDLLELEEELRRP